MLEVYLWVTQRITIEILIMAVIAIITIETLIIPDLVITLMITILITIGIIVLSKFFSLFVTFSCFFSWNQILYEQVELILLNSFYKINGFDVLHSHNVKNKRLRRHGWDCSTPSSPIRPASFFMYK